MVLSEGWAGFRACGKARKHCHSEERRRRRISHGQEIPKTEILRCAQDDNLAGFSRKPVALTFAVCLLACALAASPSTYFSQEKPAAPSSKSPQQAVILRSVTNEVLVDVRAYDKSG